MRKPNIHGQLLLNSALFGPHEAKMAASTGNNDQAANPAEEESDEKFNQFYSEVN